MTDLERRPDFGLAKNTHSSPLWVSGETSDISSEKRGLS